MNLLVRLQERLHCELDAIQQWDTDVLGEIGVYRSKQFGSVTLAIATVDQIVLYTYASVTSALEDARIIADFAGAV